jgi:hypothetical protein
VDVGIARSTLVEVGEDPLGGFAVLLHEDAAQGTGFGGSGCR